MKPKVAILTNLYPPHVLGGYEILCRQVVNALAARGWPIRVLTSDHGLSSEDPRQDEIDGITVDRLLGIYPSFGQPPVIDPNLRLAMTRENRRTTNAWLEEVKPDLVFVWSLLRATVGPARAAVDRKLPMAYTFNDANIASYAPAPLTRPHRALPDRTKYREATLIDLPLNPSTCISKIVREDLQAKLGSQADPKVIHQGVPIDELVPKANPGAAHNPFRVLYAGQIHPYKGVKYAVEAVNSLSKRHPVQLRVAGGGDEAYTKELKEIAGPNIVFLGRIEREDLIKEYQEADAFVFPSVWREPFGLTHLEAMACGTPVVSTDNGGQREFLVHEGNSLLVDPENSHSIADALERLYNDPALRKRLAIAGMELARTRYSLDRYLDDMERWLLEDVLKGAFSA